MSEGRHPITGEPVDGEAGRSGDPPPDASPSDRLPARGRRVGIPRTGFGPAQAVFGMLVAIVATTFAALIVAVVDGTAPGEEESTAAGLLGQAIFAAALAGCALGFAAAAAGSMAEGWRRLGFRSFGAGIVGPILIAIAAYIVAANIIVRLSAPDQEDIAELLGAGPDAAVATVVAVGLLIVVVAPFAEEVFFRGFIFAGLRQSLSLWPAALISGLLFGLSHLALGNLAVGIQLTVFGAILGWLYERTGTLWAPIFLHAFNNLLAFGISIA
jgi:uncharacterized protein